LPLIGEKETVFRAFCSSALWQIYPLQDAEKQIYNSLSGFRNAGLQLLFRM
jgi:hypothetical protein